MSKVKVDKDKLLQKIKTLSGTSKCIQKTSKYLYQYYKSSDLIVEIWLQALSSVSDETRLPLFYIANEMLQSRSYGNSHFKKSWKPYLVHSIDCIKDSSVNDKIRRILNIWIERKVYDKAFINDLISRLSTAKRNVKDEDQCKEIIMNFDPQDCIRKLKELIYVESQTVEPIRNHEASINFDEKLCKEAIKNLKDKRNCNQFSEQLDQNINHLFQLCTMLEEELKIRQKTFDAVTNADIYYETQQKETLIVEDAYRRYGNQISKTKLSLDKHLVFLMDDSGPMDVEDAPSPGKTPPHVYDDTSKRFSNINESPMSFDDELSPIRSGNVSEDDSKSSIDASSQVDKQYSPSYLTPDSKTGTKPKTTLSSNEAFKLLSSVFSQSLTKKPLTDVNTNVNLQPDIFHNILATSTKMESVKNDNSVTDKVSEPNTVFNDAFRLISNLTGLKNVRERTLQSDRSPNIGSTIPILTTKMSFKTSEEYTDSKQDSFSFNQSNFATSNADNIPRIIYPDIQMSNFSSPMFNPPPVVHNPMFPMFNNTSRPPPPLPPMFGAPPNNPIAFNMPPINQTSQRHSQSPGSCTEDEDDGGATPTQDETARLNSALSVPIFNKNVLSGMASVGQDELSKHIQHALASGALPFSVPPMLTEHIKDPSTNSSSSSNINNPLTSHQLGAAPPPPPPLPWNTMPGPFNPGPFPTNMAMPFSLMNASSQIKPLYNPPCNIAPTFGPPRAIRTKRPDNTESGLGVCDDATRHMDDSDSGSLSPVHDRSPVWLQSDNDSSGGSPRQHSRADTKTRSYGNGKW